MNEVNPDQDFDLDVLEDIELLWLYNEFRAAANRTPSANVVDLLDWLATGMTDQMDIRFSREVADHGTQD